MKELPKTLELVECSENNVQNLTLGFYLVVKSNGVMNVEFFNGTDWANSQNKINWFYYPKVK